MIMGISGIEVKCLLIASTQNELLVLYAQKDIILISSIKEASQKPRF